MSICRLMKKECLEQKGQDCVHRYYLAPALRCPYLELPPEKIYNPPFVAEKK